MINSKILNIIGIITVFLGISMLPSSLWSLFESTQFNTNDIEFNNFLAILLSSGITIAFGLLLLAFTGKQEKQS